MIIEAAAAACEGAMSAASIVADVVGLLAAASIRPWRYALSPAFRSSEQQKLKDRGLLFKSFYFGWGSLALLATIALIVAAMWIISDWRAERETLREERHRATVKAVKQKAIELKDRLGK